MAYKIVNDDSLTSVANAIRVQGSISGTLEFPDGFVSAIQNLSPSGNDALVITLTDSAAVSETYGYHWTPDCSYNDYYEAAIQQRPIGLKVNCTICDDAFARRINDSPSRLDYAIVEVVVDANYNAIGLANKYYQFTYNGVTLADEFFTPLPWDATAVTSDVASGKIFYTSNGREVGTATPPSGTYSITSNGIYDIVSFASVDVNVSGGGGGGGISADDIALKTLSGVVSGSAASIAQSAFTNYKYLNGAVFQSATSVGASAFYGCNLLSTASFPNAITLSTNAFGMCYSLNTTDFGKVETIGAQAFQNCSLLTTASFPNATSMGASAFLTCSSLTTAYFPKLSSIPMYAFASCKSLITTNFEMAQTISTQAFASCSSLATASFPKVTTIGNSAFSRCRMLLSLYLLGSSVPTLTNVTVFSSTPISGYTTHTGGTYGSIYVPASLVNSYKTATNWSVYSARITSYVE